MSTDKNKNNTELKKAGTMINYIVNGRSEVRSMDDLLDSLVGSKSGNNKPKEKKTTKEEDFGIYNKGSKKYNKDTIDKGKAEFKKRYVENKIQEIKSSIRRLSITRKLKISEDINKKQKELSSLKHIEMFDRRAEEIKCKIEFLLILEKVILSFNKKKFIESNDYLKDSGITRNDSEFGEFLFVVDGFDKAILGEFLAKDKKPNDKKEVVISFVNSIDMNFKEHGLLDCLSFLLSRITVPKDANLLLEIVNVFSLIFYQANKDEPKFSEIFKNSNDIYLLISTILALNTMFTRKDIKNMNVIKKEEFIKMNGNIKEEYLSEIYDELKSKPFSLSISGGYNEEIYRKLATLSKVKEKTDLNTINLDNFKNRIIPNNQQMENNDRNTSINLQVNNSKIIQGMGIINSNLNIQKEKFMEDEYYEMVQNYLDLDVSGRVLRNNYDRKLSFITNSNNFSIDDKQLLSKIYKFSLITGSSDGQAVNFIVFDDYKKLAYGKGIEQNQKSYKKYIEINQINGIYNGIDYSENIKKYIKAHPLEENDANSFFTIKYNNHKDKIDIKTFEEYSGLLWYKAMKSLLKEVKHSLNNDKILMEMKKLNDINAIIEKIWDDNILVKMNDYSQFITLKWSEKNNYFLNLQKNPEKYKNNLLDEKKPYSFEEINIFLKDKVKSDLDYYEFYSLCSLGFPEKLRKNLWKTFINNKMIVSEELYLNYKRDVDRIDVDFKMYEKETNFQIKSDYQLNQMIFDIVKSKYFFIIEITKKKLNAEKIMKAVYYVVSIFNLVKMDVPYNKGIIAITYFLLISGFTDFECFNFLMNLITGNLCRLYVGELEYTNSIIYFFDELLQKYSEKVYNYFKKLDISTELYLVDWIEKLFTQTIKYDTLLHIFDLYVINGDYILFQTAITIIKLLEEDILNFTISEIFKKLKRFPTQFTEMDFFKQFKSYNCIKDDYVKWNMNNQLQYQKKALNSSPTKK